jgi:hypothetical protein
MNPDAPTRIRVSTMDTYGTQGDGTMPTALANNVIPISRIILVVAFGATMGFIVALLP